MAYITGTITDANPGATLYALMAAQLTGTGFTLVDTVVISTRTHKIWLSAAAGNAIGKDWYLDVAYTTTGSGTLFLGVMEFFDPATDLAYRAQLSGSRPSDAVYYSPYGATGNALETAWSPVATAAAAGSTNGNLDLLSSAFGYWITITRDRVIVMLTSNATFGLYAGSYLPSAGHAAAAGTDLYPLIMAKINVQGITSAAGITRLPKHATAGTFSWALTGGGAFAGVLGLVHAPGVPADHTTVMARSAGLITITTAGTAGAGLTTPPNAYLGTLRDVASMGADATVTRGDTVTDLSANTWVLSTSNSGASFLFKAV